MRRFTFSLNSFLVSLGFHLVTCPAKIWLYKQEVFSPGCKQELLYPSSSDPLSSINPLSANDPLISSDPLALVIFLLVHYACFPKNMVATLANALCVVARGVCLSVSLCLCVYLHECVYVCMFVSMYVSACVCMSVCVCVSLCLCVYLHECVCACLYLLCLRVQVCRGVHTCMHTLECVAEL